MPHDLHLGDCLEGMKALGDKSVGAILTDPPYSERVHAALGAEGRNDGTPARQALSFAHLTGEWATTLAKEFCRIARRWIVVFGDEFTAEMWRVAVAGAGGEYVRGGVWIKPDPMPQMSGDRPGAGHEHLVIAHAARTAGRLRWNGGGRCAVWEYRGQEPGIPREHQAQKPLALMEALVSDFTDPGEIVLDPFAGSGTTGVACKRLGRNFIGWEKDPTFHAAAVKRIEAAREQYTLGLRGPKPKQGRLLP